MLMIRTIQPDLGHTALRRITESMTIWSKSRDDIHSHLEAARWQDVLAFCDLSRHNPRAKAALAAPYPLTRAVMILAVRTMDLGGTHEAKPEAAGPGQRLAAQEDE